MNKSIINDAWLEATPVVEEVPKPDLPEENLQRGKSRFFPASVSGSTGLEISDKVEDIPPGQPEPALQDEQTAVEPELDEIVEFCQERGAL